MATSTIKNKAKDWELIWENPSPTAAFSSVGLILDDLSNKSWVMIEVKRNASGENYAYFECPIGHRREDSNDNMRMWLPGGNFISSSTGNPSTVGRMVYVGASTVVFGTGVTTNWAMTSSSGNTTNSGSAIPTRIWAR